MSDADLLGFDQAFLPVTRYNVPIAVIRKLVDNAGEGEEGESY